MNIVARYVFFKPIFWAEEILIFLMIWGVYVVAISITYRGAHLCMDLIYTHVQPTGEDRHQCRRHRRVPRLHDIYRRAVVAGRLDALSQYHGVTAGTDIPLVIPQTAVLFGFSLMALTVLVRLRAYITGKFD